MELYKTWQAAYINDRFLRHLTNEELEQRIRDIFLNMMLLTPEAKIGIGPPGDHNAMHWLFRWTQTAQEMELRHGPFPNGFTNKFMQKKPIPDFVGELGRKAASLLTEKRLDPNNTYVKYGKAPHMGALLSCGSVRLNSASSYNCGDYNDAIQDDELTLAISLAMSRANFVKFAVNPEDVPLNAPDQILRVNYSSPTDYWLYCLTKSVEPRLFVDFDATACVIIKNISTFAERLERAAKSKLREAALESGMAMYVDPHRPDSANIDVPMSKHFRYSYQKEFRFIWHPASSSANLEHVMLEMGPLDDIAELVEI